MEIEITSINQFNEEIKEGKVLVDFYATWCGPCKMVAPIVEEAAKAHSDLKVLKVDVDEVGALAGLYGVQSIPTLLLFEGGELKNKQIGFLAKVQLEKFLGY